jgi:hypothetical protein
METLINIWPKTPGQQISDLVQENLADGESWGRAEKKMWDFAEPPSVLERLKIWRFYKEWGDVVERGQEFEQGLANVYKTINDSEIFREMLGYILAVGNILNGGSNKGQADGFEL